MSCLNKCVKKLVIQEFSFSTLAAPFNFPNLFLLFLLILKCFQKFQKCFLAALLSDMKCLLQHNNDFIFLQWKVSSKCSQSARCRLAAISNPVNQKLITVWCRLSLRVLSNSGNWSYWKWNMSFLVIFTKACHCRAYHLEINWSGLVSQFWQMESALKSGLTSTLLLPVTSTFTSTMNFVKKIQASKGKKFRNFLPLLLLLEPLLLRLEPLLLPELLLLLPLLLEPELELRLLLELPELDPELMKQIQWSMLEWSRTQR